VLSTVLAAATVAPNATNGTSVDVAALNIQEAINSAFAAVNLSQQGLDNATVAALEACLTTVLASGGLPDGYSCLTSVSLPFINF
jgi:methionine-rich copper-binding protein CopC